MAAAGLKLMMVGMGIVFVFLIILYAVLAGLSALFASTDQISTAHEPAPHNTPEAQGEITAVITTAIALYRRQHGRQS